MATSTLAALDFNTLATLAEADWEKLPDGVVMIGLPVENTVILAALVKLALAHPDIEGALERIGRRVAEGLLDAVQCGPALREMLRRVDGDFGSLLRAVGGKAPDC